MGLKVFICREYAKEEQRRQPSFFVREFGSEVTAHRVPWHGRLARVGYGRDARATWEMTQALMSLCIVPGDDPNQRKVEVCPRAVRIVAVDDLKFERVFAIGEIIGDGTDPEPALVAAPRRSIALGGLPFAAIKPIAEFRRLLPEIKPKRQAAPFEGEGKSCPWRGREQRLINPDQFAPAADGPRPLQTDF